MKCYINCPYEEKDEAKNWELNGIRKKDRGILTI